MVLLRLTCFLASHRPTLFLSLFPLWDTLYLNQPLPKTWQTQRHLQLCISTLPTVYHIHMVPMNKELHKTRLVRGLPLPRVKRVVQRLLYTPQAPRITSGFPLDSDQDPEHGQTVLHDGKCVTDRG